MIGNLGDQKLTKILHTNQHQIFKLRNWDFFKRNGSIPVYFSHAATLVLPCMPFINGRFHIYQFSLFSCTQFDLWNLQRIINFQLQQRTLAVGTPREIRCLIIHDFQTLIVNDNLLGCRGSILALVAWHEFLRLKCLLAVDLDLPEFFFHLRSSVLEFSNCSDIADTKSLLADHLDWFDLVLSLHTSNNHSYPCSSGVAWFSKWVLFLVIMIWELLPKFTLLQVIR